MDLVLDCFNNCAYNGSSYGGKGTTVWHGNDYTLGGFQDYTYSFTDTDPECCDGGTQLCLITYELVTSDTVANSIVIYRYLNDVFVGSTTHSQIAGHNVTEAFDVEPLNAHGVYVHGGLNRFKFVNASGTSFQIKNFRVFRAYPLRNLYTGQPTCPGASDPGSSGSIDYSRNDYPCNFASIGDRVSFVHWGANFEAVPIGPGDSIKWTFRNPDNDNVNNYVGSCACFFNFNNVSRSFDLGADTEYKIKLNDVEVATYYHGGYLGFSSQFPTVDLAQFPGIYHDEPGQTNTVELVNTGVNSIATLAINNSQDLGGVDIFRFYKVTNICKDDFSDENMTKNIWGRDAFGIPESIQIGGSVQTNPQLQVSVPGSGYKQAGKVTRYPYDGLAFYPGSDKQGFEAAIDITSIGTLRSLEFFISNVRTLNSDPYSLSNFYLFMKDRTDTTVKIQRRLGGGAVSSMWRWWNASTGTQKIKVSGGSIGFYENGILRHAEPFMLPSSNCYIYAYTSSDLAGTGVFDNFSIKPAEGVIKNNFDDGNCNGWSVVTGIWGVTNGKLQSAQVTPTSQIRYQAIASPNRHVAADIQTLSGSGTGNVAFLMVNEVNSSNMIYADITRAGTVELIIFYNGIPTAYTYPGTGLDPCANNRIAVTITGTNAKVYVNNTLYIDVTDPNFANISNGYVGFYTYNSTGSLDNLVVFTQ
jgi:hypothetical protein